MRLKKHYVKILTLKLLESHIPDLTHKFCERF